VTTTTQPTAPTKRTKITARHAQSWLTQLSGSMWRLPLVLHVTGFDRETLNDAVNIGAVTERRKQRGCRYEAADVLALVDKTREQIAADLKSALREHTERTLAGSNRPNKNRRRDYQKENYALIKRVNYWFEKHGEDKQKFWRVGLKSLSPEYYEKMADKYEENKPKRKPFFVYDSRKPGHVPLRGMVALSESDVYALVRRETTEEMLKDVEAGKIPAGCYQEKQYSSQSKRKRMPRGHGQGLAYLQPRTGLHPWKKRRMPTPLVEETLEEFKPIIGHQELTPVQYAALVASLRQIQANVFQPVACPLCGAPKFAALQKDGLTLRCFMCKQSCEVGTAVSEAKTA
jgi:hypothetical protein